MTDRLTLAIAQLNPTMGDIAGNAAKLRAVRIDARAAGADLLITPELYLSGYPPEDLVLRPRFMRAVLDEAEALARETADGGPAILLGLPILQGEWRRNAVLLLAEGQIQTSRAKVHLPNYGVFDEKRVFTPGGMPGPIFFKGLRLGVPICEDIWDSDVAECLEESGAEILIVPNASPFECGKTNQRMQVALKRIAETQLPLVYINQVGGQDELIFDGASFALNADYTPALQMPAFEEGLAILQLTRATQGWRISPQTLAPALDELETLYQAMMLGLRDYIGKNKFPGVVIGLSGGVDSALTAAVAVDALGADQVRCVMMPSRFTSAESHEDAAACAHALGLGLETLPIEPAFNALLETLMPAFEGRPSDVTEENLQSRIRGILLMALSNKFGPMVLTTGNKSEMAVGYATLYGDMCGGYSVLKDIYKTDVYRLAEWRNIHCPRNGMGPGGIVIPSRVLSKAPSAELRADQTDQDSLPPYEVLDAILYGLIEEERSVHEIAQAHGYEEALVARVQGMLFKSEYKRRQAPPGVKLTSRSFGRERRYPITNAFRDHYGS